MVLTRSPTENDPSSPAVYGPAVLVDRRGAADAAVLELGGDGEVVGVLAADRPAGEPPDRALEGGGIGSTAARRTAGGASAAGGHQCERQQRRRETKGNELPCHRHTPLLAVERLSNLAGMRSHTTPTGAPMDKDTSATGAQIVYLSHGGGPLPLLGDPGHDAMVAFMRQLGPRLRRPDAVLVVSAHWEERVATVQGGADSAPVLRLLRLPRGGVSHLVPGARRPRARRAHRRRPGRHGITVAVDPERGFDHGAFIPLLLMFPEADVPALQLSLLHGLDPQSHIALGTALGDLRAENILVLGSGFSFHNMAAFDWRGDRRARPAERRLPGLADRDVHRRADTSRSGSAVCWTGRPPRTPATPIRGRSTCCRCTSARAWRSGRASSSSTTAIVGKRSVAFLWCLRGGPGRRGTAEAAVSRRGGRCWI